MPLGMPSRGNLGNPLGRAQTVAAAPARTSRYDVRFIANVSITALPSSATQLSPTIMFNGKAIAYFSESASPALYRHTFDYSAAGVTNNVSTYVDATSTVSQLPAIPTPMNSANANCQWTHTVSGTQMLCKYSQLRPFLVTWNGTGDSSFAYPTATGAVTGLMTDADAFLLPNGNLGLFGRDSSTGVFLCEYTPTLTHVRNFSLGTMTGLTGGIYQARIRRTSYGYVVGLMHNQDGTGVRCMAITLNRDCTTVIASRLMYMSAGTFTTTPEMWSIIAGEDGIIFINRLNGGTQFGCLNVPVYSDGSIANILTPQYADNSQSSLTSQVLSSFVGRHPVSGGCTKFADALAPSFFCSATSYSLNRGLVMVGKSFSSDGNSLGYVDMQLEPIINSEPTNENATIWAADVNRTVNAAYGIAHSQNAYGVNLNMDENGFIYLSNGSGSGGPSARLLRRVSR